MCDPAEYLYHLNVPEWLHIALFDLDPMRARAAEANLRRALRHEAGQAVALIETASLLNLVRTSLPRVWTLRREVIAQRRAEAPLR